MDPKANYTVVGIFVVVLVTMLVFSALWLSSLRHNQSYNDYVTYVHEEVSGLGPESPVRFNGVKIGYVQSLRINPKDPQQVEVLLAIESGTPITTSTIAVLQTQGITGVDYIGLRALTANAPILKAAAGDKYPVIPSQPSLLVKLSTAVQEVTSSITKLTTDVNKIFDADNRQAIQASLQNIKDITSAIAKNSQDIDSTLKNSNIVMQNAAEASKQLPEIMKDLNATLASVRATSDKFGATSASISHAMNTTSNTVQRVGQEVVPSVQALVDHLNVIASNLQSVSSQMKQNPAVIVRGSQPAPLGPGER